MKFEIKKREPDSAETSGLVAIFYFIYITILGIFSIIPLWAFALGWILPLFAYWLLSIKIRKIK